MITKKIIQDADVTWAQSQSSSKAWRALCVTSTGRIIATTSNDYIYYSDDNGVTWTQSQSLSKLWRALCVTSTGRIIAATGNNYIY